MHKTTIQRREVPIFSWRTLSNRQILIGLAVVAVVAAAVFGVLYEPADGRLLLDGDQVAGPATLKLTTKASMPHYLTVTITGQVDGVATIKTHDSMETKIGPGRVDTIIRNEFYSSECDAIYTPVDVKHGHLKFSWRFQSI